MTETTARIRWEETSLGEFAGRVGTIRWLAYQMRPPAYDGGAWQLTSYIPGSIGKCTHYDDREEAQAKAEEWLTEFIASIGAVFPEGGDWPGRGWAYAGRERDGNLVLKHEESSGLYRVIPEEDL